MFGGDSGVAATAAASARAGVPAAAVKAVKPAEMIVKIALQGSVLLTLGILAG